MDRGFEIKQDYLGNYLLFTGPVNLEKLLIFQAAVSSSIEKRLCELMHIKQWLVHIMYFKNVNQYTFSIKI